MNRNTSLGIGPSSIFHIKEYEMASTTYPATIYEELECDWMKETSDANNPDFMLWRDVPVEIEQTAITKVQGIENELGFTLCTTNDYWESIKSISVKDIWEYLKELRDWHCKDLKKIYWSDCWQVSGGGWSGETTSNGFTIEYEPENDPDCERNTDPYPRAMTPSWGLGLEILSEETYPQLFGEH